MKKTEKKKINTFLSDDAPGIAGIIYCILTYVLGPVIIVGTICFVLNFACEFVGVDFDAFLWVEELVADLPALMEGWFEAIPDLVKTLTQ